MYCSNCGAKLPQDARFCAKCGQKVPQHAVAPNPRPVDVPEGTPPANTAKAHATPPRAAHASQTGRQGQDGPKGPRASNKVAIAVITCAVVAVIACVGIVMGGLGGATGSNGATGSGAAASSALDADGSRYSVTSANGTVVVSLQRPMLVTLSPSDVMSAAPALARYTSSDTTSETGSNAGTDSLQNTLGNVITPSPEVGLANVANADDFYLTSELTQALVDNQFVVDASDSRSEFFDIYESNRYGVLASFVTTDSLMHTYHLYFSHLLKNTEKNYLTSKLLSTSQAMLAASNSQYEALAGTEWESAAERNCAFFGVACILLGADAELPSIVADTVQAEVSKIQAGEGGSTCAITGDSEDYSQYKPRGYYEGDEQLERYFRTMMWYGRINFTQNATSHQDPSDLNRSALLITIALDGGQGGTPDTDWAEAYTVTSFFAGASDDCGYYEYYPLFEAAYGEGAGIDALPGNDEAWDDYNAMTSLMQAPRISSVIVHDEASVSDDDIKGFRFMGQRFSLDEAIFQQLVYDNVEDRLLPSALDLPAALGSDEALSILEDEGETSYGGYSSQMEATRTEVAGAGDSIWTGSLYSQWLYTLNPLLTAKGEGYPSFMQSSEWARKSLQTYLGSYAELKHDTVLYSKQIMAEMGGELPNNDDRGYVEPEPELYARLSNLVQSTSEGLAGYGMLSDADAENLDRLKQLADQFETMSEKELAGTELSSDEYDLIRSYGGQLEHFWEEVNPEASASAARSSEAPAAVVVDIATDNDDGTVLEVGTGKVSTIYVLVPIAGELHLCSGGVYSYYEFTWPQSDRLTDSTWREMLGITGGYQQSADLPDRASWTDSFTRER